MSKYSKGQTVTISSTGESARVVAVQTDSITGHIFYRLEIWPDTPDRMFDTVAEKMIQPYSDTAPSAGFLGLTAPQGRAWVEIDGDIVAIDCACGSIVETRHGSFPVVFNHPTYLVCEGVTA